MSYPVFSVSMIDDKLMWPAGIGQATRESVAPEKICPAAIEASLIH
jgi:hypothetical protein